MLFKLFESLIDSYPHRKPTVPPKNLFKFAWAMSDGCRWQFFLLTFSTGLIGVFEALLFAMLGDIADWLTGSPTRAIWSSHSNIFSIVIVFLLSSIPLVVLADVLKYQTIFGNFPMRIRWNLHRLMLGQSMDFFNDEFAGRISAKVMQTALSLRSVFIILGDILVFIVIYFLTMVLVLGTFSSFMLIPFASWLILYIFLLRYFIPRISAVSKKRADAISLLSGRVTDSYTNISTIKLFSYSDREAEYSRESMEECTSYINPSNRLTSLLEMANHGLSVVLIIMTGGTVLWLWSRGNVGVGAVAASFAMSFRLMGLSHWVMYEMAALFEHVGTVRDGIKMFSKRCSVKDIDGAENINVSKGDIDIRSITFSYDKKNNVMENLNLKIKAGERIGLVGQSGGGKSTLVNLLLRFFDIDRGRILFDEQDISRVTQSSVRKNIAMVAQDTSLLHRSVRDNLKYGRPSSTDAEMLAATKMAQAHNFILKLNDSKGRTGYDAHVGERGVKLSGGQRQRIAIARVILKNSPILILDEATSALDSEIESAIQESLKTLMKGKTVIAIAHRLSTIAQLDRLIVIDKGKILEDGSHDELLKRNGMYSRLWKLQSGGFLGTSLNGG